MREKARFKDEISPIAIIGKDELKIQQSPKRDKTILRTKAMWKKSSCLRETQKIKKLIHIIVNQQLIVLFWKIFLENQQLKNQDWR